MHHDDNHAGGRERLYRDVQGIEVDPPATGAVSPGLDSDGAAATALARPERPPLGTLGASEKRPAAEAGDCTVVILLRLTSYVFQTHGALCLWFRLALIAVQVVIGGEERGHGLQKALQLARNFLYTSKLFVLPYSVPVPRVPPLASWQPRELAYYSLGLAMGLLTALLLLPPLLLAVLFGGFCKLPASGLSLERQLELCPRLCGGCR